MNKDLDAILKKAMIPGEDPGEELNQKIIKKAKEESSSMKKTYLRPSVAAAVFLCIFVVGSLSAVAAYKFLPPSQVAKEAEQPDLAKAFEGEDGVKVDEKQESNGYIFHLLGLTSGEGLENYFGEENEQKIAKEQTYIVLAIEKADGSKMPDMDSDDYLGSDIFTSPYIKGKDPAKYNAYTLGGGYEEFEKHGIVYRLFSCDTLEMFADRGVYLGISVGLAEQDKAFSFDKETGVISKNPNYTGLSALFELPLDESKADYAAAEKYFDSIDNPSDINNSSEEADGKAEDKTEAEIFMEQLTESNLEEYAKPILSSKQVLTPDSEDMVTWKDAEGGEGSLYVGGWQKEKGKTQICGYSCGEDMDSLRIYTFADNGDGTFTFLEYAPK